MSNFIISSQSQPTIEFDTFINSEDKYIFRLICENTHTFYNSSLNSYFLYTPNSIYSEIFESAKYLSNPEIIEFDIYNPSYQPL